MPSMRAASATPCAWLPALAATTPRARSAASRRARRVYAPRILNEPVRCRFSHLSHTGRRTSSDERARTGHRGARARPPSSSSRAAQHVVDADRADDPMAWSYAASSHPRRPWRGATDGAAVARSGQLERHRVERPARRCPWEVGMTRLRAIAPLLVAASLTAVAVATAQAAGCDDPGALRAARAGTTCSSGAASPPATSWCRPRRSPRPPSSTREPRPAPEHRPTQLGWPSVATRVATRRNSGGHPSQLAGAGAHHRRVARRMPRELRGELPRELRGECHASCAGTATRVASGGGQCRAQVLDQVLDVLDADREPDEVVRHLQLRAGHATRASSPRGARSATPRRRATRPSVNSFVARADPQRRLLAARDRERHHAAEAAHLLRGDLVAGVLGQARVEHLRRRPGGRSAARRCARRCRSGAPSARRGS